MPQLIDEIVKIFKLRGNEKYGEEAVTQLEHALQCATLAENSGASDEMIIASLLHDIGHLLSDHQLPLSLDENLHDHHEERGYEWIKESFGNKVADPVRLHVEAKRYLCTIHPDYASKLSPTSLKSFYDQGGVMSEEEKQHFEQESHFKEAVKVREWDDIAKDPRMKTKDLEYYIPLIEKLIITK